jgi:hypothetical protein
MLLPIAEKREALKKISIWALMMKKEKVTKIT